MRFRIFRDRNQIVMKTRCILPLVFLLLSLSCKTEMLNTAEYLLETHPDSSLAIMNSIDIHDLHSQEERARYSLILSAALDKNYIDIQSDSIISVAVDYYSNRKCSNYRMRSWYYHGIVLKNSRDFVPSMLSFEKAENDAIKLNEFLYLGLIYRNKAALHNYTNNNPAAIDCQKKAVYYFDLANAPLYKQYSEASLAIDYSNNLEFGKADSLLSGIITHTSDSLLKAQCVIRRASILVKRDTLFRKAIRGYRRYPQKLYDLLDYAYLAQAYERVGQSDSADYWMTEGYAHCKNREQSATLDFMASRLKMNRKDFESAFYLIDHATSVQDSLTRALLQESLSIAQRDYYQNETMLKEVKIQRLREKMTLEIILSVLALLLLISITSLQARSKERLLQEQMARLAMEERYLKWAKEENAHLVGSLFNEKIGRLEELTEIYFNEEDPQKKNRFFKQVKQIVSSLHNDPTLFPSLEKDLDRYCDGVMSKLKNQVPSIKGATNLHTIMLFFAGYSYPVVQLIMNKISIESLKVARSRFRKEIRSAKAEDADLFLKMLEVKKRSQADTNDRLPWHDIET